MKERRWKDVMNVLHAETGANIVTGASVSLAKEPRLCNPQPAIDFC